jgi:hypothetical protein
MLSRRRARRRIQTPPGRQGTATALVTEAREILERLQACPWLARLGPLERVGLQRVGPETNRSRGGHYVPTVLTGPHGPQLQDHVRGTVSATIKVGSSGRPRVYPSRTGPKGAH